MAISTAPARDISPNSSCLTVKRSFRNTAPSSIPATGTVAIIEPEITELVSLIPRLSKVKYWKSPRARRGLRSFFKSTFTTRAHTSTFMARNAMENRSASMTNVSTVKSTTLENIKLNPNMTFPAMAAAAAFFLLFMFSPAPILLSFFDALRGPPVDSPLPLCTIKHRCVN